MLKRIFKPAMKLAMAIQTFLYRLTGGRIGGSGRDFRVLLLTTTGRKSGKERTTPLGYFEDQGAYIITASSTAFLGEEPAWFLNLKSNPQVKIQVMDKRLAAIAEQAAPEERNRLWARLIEVSPSYAEYQKRTTREIPMVILRPVEQH